MSTVRKTGGHLFDLGSRVALVTGASSGLGAALARALARAGADLAIAARRAERLSAIAAEVEGVGRRCLAVPTDVTNEAQVERLVTQATEVFGGIDILVNGAEIFHPEPLLSIDEWNWRRQLEVNITGAFFCLQLVARVMADEGGGTIINVMPAEALGSTIASGIGYLTGKAGVFALTRQAARELASSGIRVNAIAFGLEEDWSLPAESGGLAVELYDGPEGIGGAAQFLCSEAARSISGQVLVVRGRQGALDR